MSPNALPRPCREHGCPRLTTSPDGYCDEHKREERREQDRLRGSSASRGYGADWRRARDRYLRTPGNQLCRACAARGRVTPATEVDHIRPHRGDRVLFWDESNWQPLCQRCHSAKTAREDGRWGSGASGG